MPPTLYPGVHGGMPQTHRANIPNLAFVAHKMLRVEPSAMESTSELLNVLHTREKRRVMTVMHKASAARYTAGNFVVIAEFMGRHATKRRRWSDKEKGKQKKTKNEEEDKEQEKTQKGLGKR